MLHRRREYDEQKTIVVMV